MSVVKASLHKTELGYFIRLPFKDETHPSVNYCIARGQLNQVKQKASCDQGFFSQYDGVIQDYVDRNFIEGVPNYVVD